MGVILERARLYIGFGELCTTDVRGRSGAKGVHAWVTAWDLGAVQLQAQPGHTHPAAAPPGDPRCETGEKMAVTRLGR